MKTILAIDARKPPEQSGFCLIRDNVVLYLGTDPDKTRGYKINEIVISESVSREELADILSSKERK